jgi:hypothetical protein
MRPQDNGSMWEAWGAGDTHMSAGCAGVGAACAGAAAVILKPFESRVVP